MSKRFAAAAAVVVFCKQRENDDTCAKIPKPRCPFPSSACVTRKLLKVIEALQIERRLDGHQDGVVGGGFLRGEAQDIGANDDAEYSREDIRRLRLENRNMQLLLVENRELKRQAKEDAARGKEKQRALTAEVESLRGQLRGISATAAERDKWQHDRDGRSSRYMEGGC